MRKKQKRNVSTIGRDNYEFDCKKEKNIYCYLCGINTNKNEIKKISEREQMNTYSEWEQYINKKYEKYPIEKLKEFSRYLNQRIRNIKPNQEYWNIILPILITLIATEAFNFLVGLAIVKPQVNIELTITNLFIMFGVFFIVTLGIIILLLVFVLKVIAPIWENHTEEKMLEDYKEIIDKMIEEKVEMEEDTNHQ